MTDRSVVVRVTAIVSGYMSSMAAASKVTKDFGVSSIEAAAKHRESWDRVGKGAMVAGGLVALGVGEAIKAAAEFDAKMSVVKANIDDKTAPSMKRLADAALEAGHKTMFSASQAAEAENELAKAGVSAADIVGGALTASLSLASAGQLDLGAAAEYTASTMVQFGLHAKDTGHIADVLAAAADKSLGGVSDIAEALKYAGVSASQFGISLDETVGVLAEFASNGLMGSMAGTGVREMLVRLVKPTLEAQGVMKDLGLTFFDSQGKFLGLANMAGQLHDKMAKLTDQQRQQALVTLFGQRAMAEGNILFRDGAAGVQKWTQAVNDQGFAALQASTKMDNLNGDLTKLKNTLNATFIETGQNGQGPLRGLVQNVTGAIDTFGHLPKPVEQSALMLGALGATALIVGGGIVLTTSKVAALKASLTGMGMEAEFASTALKGIGTVGAIAAVGVPIWQAGAHSISESLHEVAPGAKEAAAGLLEFSTTGKATGDSADLINRRFADLGNTVNNVLSGSIGHKVSAFFSEISPGNLTGFERSQTNLSIEFFKTLDNGLAELSQSGHADQAAALFKRVSDEAKRQGYSISQVADALPAYAAAAGHAADKTKDAAVAASEQSKALVSLGADANAVGSAMAVMGQGADAASDSVKALAKVIQGDMDSASKAFMKDMDVLGQYDPAKAADKAKAANDALTSAQENAQYVRERVAAKKKKTIADEHALDKANDAVNKARTAAAAANTAQGAAGLEQAYRTAIAKGQKFTQDINAVIRRGLDPQVVAKLLQEGPDKAGPALQAMLGKNSTNLIKMVDASEAQIRRMNATVVEQARLTAMAVNAQSDQMPKDLDKAMGMAQLKSMGNATYESVAKKLHMTPAEAERIAKEFGIGLSHIPAPKPVPLNVNTKAGLAAMHDFRQQLANLDGVRVTTYIDTIATLKDSLAGAGSQSGAPKSSWQQLYGINPSGQSSKVYPNQQSMATLQQVLGAGRPPSHSVVNNSPINIAQVSGPNLDDIRRQAEQQARLRGLAREQTR